MKHSFANSTAAFLTLLAILAASVLGFIWHPIVGIVVFVLLFWLASATWPEPDR